MSTELNTKISMSFTCGIRCDDVENLIGRDLSDEEIFELVREKFTEAMMAWARDNHFALSIVPGKQIIKRSEV